MGDIRKEIADIEQHLRATQRQDKICANRQCQYYDAKAVMASYPSSVYCSLECKYNDTDSMHRETYGD